MLIIDNLLSALAKYLKLLKREVKKLQTFRSKGTLTRFHWVWILMGYILLVLHNLFLDLCYYLK